MEKIEDFVAIEKEAYVISLAESGEWWTRVLVGFGRCIDHSREAEYSTWLNPVVFGSDTFALEFLPVERGRMDDIIWGRKPTEQDVINLGRGEVSQQELPHGKIDFKKIKKLGEELDNRIRYRKGLQANCLHCGKLEVADRNYSELDTFYCEECRDVLLK